jgi:glutathione synthase
MLAGDLAWRDGRDHRGVRSALRPADDHAWFAEGEEANGAIWRTSMPCSCARSAVRSGLLYATWLLERGGEGARICTTGRNPCATTTRKVAIARFPQFIAPTLVSNDAAMIRGFLAEHRRHHPQAVERMGGSGIFRVTRRMTQSGRNVSKP